jgi:hypothetical protein
MLNRLWRRLARATWRNAILRIVGVIVKWPIAFYFQFMSTILSRNIGWLRTTTLCFKCTRVSDYPCGRRTRKNVNTEWGWYQTCSGTLWKSNNSALVFSFLSACLLFLPPKFSSCLTWESFTIGERDVGLLVSNAVQNVGWFCVESCVRYASVCIRTHKMKFLCACGLEYFFVDIYMP